MFENPRRGRQATNFTKSVPKILDLKSSSEQIFSENWRWDSQKDSSSIEEKMFSKVTLPSTLIFSAKDVCTINLTVLVTYICIRNRVRSVSLWDCGLRDCDIIGNIQRWIESCILFPQLRAWDVQTEKSTKILISWQELKNQFLSFLFIDS